MLSRLFIATTHQNSMSIYFSEQENTEIKKIFFLTFDYRKNTYKSVLTNLDLKDSHLHWVSSVAKKEEVLKDVKK